MSKEVTLWCVFNHDKVKFELLKGTEYDAQCASDIYVKYDAREVRHAALEGYEEERPEHQRYTEMK